MKTTINLMVNGEAYQCDVAPRTTLVELLRDELHLTGTKEGCGEGDCGTCVVLMDGRAVNSCLVLALDARGHKITTIEGLADGENLHPLQQSFIDHGAVQCGFCSPGMILSAKSLLDKKPDASEEEIKKALAGVSCRCGSYQKIIKATKAAQKKMKESA